jgi:hypothetical protein
MGRAFVGVADDASAAITNPAGLMFLTKPQVYVEFKASGYEQADPVDGSIFTFSSLSGRMPFFAISTPIGNRVSVAFSRNEFFGADFTVLGDKLELRGSSYAGSISTSIRPDLKVGATISRASLSAKAAGVDVPTDSATGFTIGGLWQANEQVSIGISGTKWTTDPFVVPDQIKFGVGITPNPQWKVAVDVVRVSFQEDVAEDQTEFHAGGEYQLMPIGMTRVLLRAGVFTGKESSFDNLGNVETNTKGTGTFGVGFVVGQQYQIDLAVLTRKEFVASAAFRFGR